MRMAIYTLGCKVNQYETQAMEGELRRRGHTLVSFEEEAEVYIVNTCTVTQVSDKKCRSVIRGVKRRCPNALVAVCGCYAQTAPDAVAALGVDLIGGSTGRMAFLDRVEELSAGERKGGPAGWPVAQVGEERTFERLPAGGLSGRTRAMLKVEDGCMNFCTYCIIPYARGPVRSLPLQEAVREAGRLEREGYREIVLTGIEISSWGRETPGSGGLIELIEGVCAAAPGVRIRLGSLEPRTVTQAFCRRGAALSNLCPHFHLSLQSGCDATLRRMNRHYDTAGYGKSVELLRTYFDDPGITTDVIVGFPGETEEEFAQSLTFVEGCGFSALHVFPYSRRRGTPAAGMEGQVPRGEKEARARRAIEVGKSLKRAFLARQVGKETEVLFEEKKDGLWRGYAPNYAEVRVRAEEELHNGVRRVILTGAEEGFLRGELEGGKP